MTLFEITKGDIEALSDIDLRELVGRLAEQEAELRGHSRSSVTYGGDQRAKDGGIDVRVELNGGEISGYVPTLQTGFQVKAEDMAAADIQKEMRPKGVLRPSIVELGERDGAYIIVSSKGATSDTALNARRNAMAAAIADAPTAQNLHLEFYDRQRLASWVNKHPGLIPWVRSCLKKPLSGWKPYADWSSSPGKTDEEYLLDEGIRIVSPHTKDEGISAADGLSRVRDTLSRPRGIVRLAGLSGVGKTRFAQALFDDRVGENASSPNVVVYTDLADDPDPVPLDLVARLQDLRQRCVVIVDNCGVDLHRKLASEVRSENSPLSLLTIEYDIRDDEPEGTDVFRLEPASADLIEKIVKRKHPQLTNPELRTIASFSDGNSRIALALADTAKSGRSLANLNDSELFKRLFRQRHDDNPALLRAAKICSLVYSFDGETLEGDEAELPVLAALAGQAPDDFYAHVAELHRRQLVQKRSRWRAFLPHALAHKLAKEALQEIPSRNLIGSFTADDVPERLTTSFSRRLGYLHDAPEAQEIAKLWLAADGWLADVSNLNTFGLTLFTNIAPIDPRGSLAAIKRAFPKLDKANAHYHQQLVRILRSLAYDATLFSDAAELIGEAAGDAEDSNNLGDAVNVFASLFHLYLSGTHASPAQRADLLRQLARVGNPRDQALVMRGLAGMHETGHFSSSHGFDFGSRKRDYGYHPRTNADVHEWYMTALDLASELEQIPALRVRVRNLIARELATLARDLGMVTEVTSLAERFTQDGGWPEGWIGAKNAAKEAKRRKQKEAAERLEALADKLQPKSIRERIECYLGPPDWSALDIADIDYDDPNRYEKARLETVKICAAIGTELAQDPQKLAEILPILLRAQSQRIHDVGRALGLGIADPLKGWEILTNVFLSEDYPIPVLLATYLGGVGRKNRDVVETIMDNIFANVALHDHFVLFQAMAGISPRACERILQAVELDTVPTHSFHRLGMVTDELSGLDLHRILSALLTRTDSYEVALEIMSMRLYDIKSGRAKLSADDLLLGREILSKVTFKRNQRRDSYQLGQIANACLASSGDDRLADEVCTKLRQSIHTYDAHAWDYGDLINVFATRFPRVVLDVFVAQATGSSSRRDLFSSLRENRPDPLDKIDEQTLLDWANEDAEVRFPALADVIRPWRKAEGQNEENEDATLVWTTSALRLIDESPAPLQVLESFYRRFEPMSWSGSRAAMMETRLQLLVRLASDARPEIAVWARNAVDAFTKRVVRERERELEWSREEDERFEY